MNLFVSTQDAEEYSESLAQIGEGWWRQIAWAFRVGIPEALGMAPREWAVKYHGYARMPVDERREAVRELTSPVNEGGMGMTQPQAADVLGVGLGTINRDLHHDDPIPDGKSEPETERVPGAGPQVGDGTLDFGERDLIPDGKPEPVADATEPAGESPRSTRDLLAQSDENEWYTPRRFTAAAAAVLGSIDLDPASSAVANEIVGASRYYTINDNGLDQPWRGTVWLNPPYGGENRLFVERLIREYEAGNVSAGIALVNCHPAETQWFQRLFDYTVCFVRGRIDFTGPARDRASTSTHGSAIAYLGPHWESFASEFSRFGAVVRRV